MDSKAFKMAIQLGILDKVSSPCRRSANESNPACLYDNRGVGGSLADAGLTNKERTNRLIKGEWNISTHSHFRRRYKPRKHSQFS